MIPHVLALCALLTRVILKALTLQKCVHVCFVICLYVRRVLECAITYVVMTEFNFNCPEVTLCG